MPVLWQTLQLCSFDRPDVAPANLKKEPNSALNLEGKILTEDFCRLGEDRLVRCIVEIPLLGLSDPFVVGVWSSLSQPNFDRFIETFDDGHQSELGEMTSWLCNPILGDAQYPAAVWMLPQDGKQRPRLEFANQDHPLYKAQKNGLSFDDFAQLLKTYGHDIDCAPIN